jgi:hypothetical protein
MRSSCRVALETEEQETKSRRSASRLSHPQLHGLFSSWTGIRYEPPQSTPAGLRSFRELTTQIHRANLFPTKGSAPIFWLGPFEGRLPWPRVCVSRYYRGHRRAGCVYLGDYSGQRCHDQRRHGQRKVRSDCQSPRSNVGLTMTDLSGWF